MSNGEILKFRTYPEKRNILPSFDMFKLYMIAGYYCRINTAEEFTDKVRSSFFGIKSKQRTCIKEKIKENYRVKEIV